MQETVYSPHLWSLYLSNIKPKPGSYLAGQTLRTVLVNSRGLGSGDEREHFVETAHHGGSGGSQSLSWLTVYTSVLSAVLLQSCGTAIADCGLLLTPGGLTMSLSALGRMSHGTVYLKVPQVCEFCRCVGLSLLAKSL